MTHRSGTHIYDPYDGQGHIFADQVHEADKPTTWSLLGRDGKPIPRNLPKMGFDLSPKVKAKP